MQFDVYFYPFNLLDATPVQSRMIRRQDMFAKTIAPGDEKAVVVLQLARDLRAQGHTRIPFVTSDDKFVYIAHRSMLDQFLVEQLTPDSADEIGRLTLADLFERHSRVRDIFTSTAAFVSVGATLGDAKMQMNSTANCYDVFVTENGRPVEPVVGWITDVIVASSEPT